MLSLLTLIFVALKLAEVGSVAGWSWWLVLAPTLVQFAVVLLLFILAAFAAGRQSRLRSW